MRALKGSGAEKSAWEPEVAILKTLKDKLAALTGKPAEQPGKKKKK